MISKYESWFVFVILYYLIITSLSIEYVFYLLTLIYSIHIYNLSSNLNHHLLLDKMLYYISIK